MTTQDFWIVGGIALGCIGIAGWVIAKLWPKTDEEAVRALEDAQAEAQWRRYHESKH